jgi:putative membrane protein
MPLPLWKKNDKKASKLIIAFSVIVFLIVASVGRLHLDVDPGFNVHLFAKLNAIVNSIVAVLLVTALIAVKNKKYVAHHRIMLTAMVLSILFLASYITHHLLAGETKFGGGHTAKIIYYIILFTHIPLAGIILPFILFAAYRALIGEYERHKKLVRVVWPLWFYVAVTGVIVYIMISPYYT